MHAMVRHPGLSRYQRLVERWVDITAWPTAKKTVVAMASAAVAIAVVGAMALSALLLSPGLVDLRGALSVWDAWMGMAIVVALLALPSCCYATVGVIGFDQRWDYTVLGTVMNQAARLVGVAKHGQILVSERLLEAVESLVEAEPIGELTLKGLRRPLTTFDIRRCVRP